MTLVDRLSRWSETASYGPVGLPDGSVGSPHGPEVSPYGPVGLPEGNSIVYRNNKVCDGLASLYDGVPSYIVLLKWLQSIISQIESFHMMESHHMMDFQTGGCKDVCLIIRPIQPIYFLKAHASHYIQELKNVNSFTEIKFVKPNLPHKSAFRLRQI